MNVCGKCKHWRKHVELHSWAVCGNQDSPDFGLRKRLTNTCDKFEPKEK